jgi:hypothetical protein
MTGKRVRASLVAVGLATAVLVGSGPSWAGIAQPDVVVKTPVSYTPHIKADARWSRPIAFSVAQLGNTVYVGGRFNEAENANRTVTYVRHNLMAFDATTGQMRSFAPNVDGDVWAIEATPGAIYIGGRFKNIDGKLRPAIAKLDPVTGALDPAFQPKIKGARVSDIQLVDGRLILGGSFSKKLTALNPATGKSTNYINASISGKLPLSTDKSEVFKFTVNPAGTRLVAVGNFTTVDGVNRQRAFMLNLDATGDTLSDWYYPPLDRRCRTTTGNRIAYLQDVDFSPDGSYFVFVATGWVPQTTAEIGTAVCDAAARFEVDELAPDKPTWINYTGGDTLHAVEVTGAAVYVQGHSRWLDNPYGNDSAGPGAVVRWGGGSINPVTGMANDWDPVMKHVIGGYDFLATDAGLWTVSEGKRFDGKYHRGIVFTPLP